MVMTEGYGNKRQPWQIKHLSHWVPWYAWYVSALYEQLAAPSTPSAERHCNHVPRMGRWAREEDDETGVDNVVIWTRPSPTHRLLWCRVGLLLIHW